MKLVRLTAPIPAYFSQINAQLDGHSFGAFVGVPEPSAWAVLVGLVALVAAWHRRRRSD